MVYFVSLDSSPDSMKKKKKENNFKKFKKTKQEYKRVARTLTNI